MIRRCCFGFIALATCLALTWALHVPTTGAQEKTIAAQKEDAAQKGAGKKQAHRAFMRKKLEYAQNVLEGLALEDFDLVAKGAKELKTTSAAAEFMVIHEPLYAEYADDFRKIAEKLAKAAKEKRIDGATLAYMDMTMSCVECHKYVRNILVAK